MDFFEKNISFLIENQFPSFYKEEGPVFIEFMKKYYEWMETANNSIYHSRRILEYKDIDSTVDQFILYFKSKYLNAIQFDTATNVKQLVKHSLDLYRSKGTERSIDLFFKLVYGKPAEVYYPGNDVFRLSSGNWIIPKYLEVEYSDNLKNFVGLQIEGVNSGATAFVERYIRKKIKGKYVELLYLSVINGTFQKYEQIKSSTTNVLGPMILGSINDIDVVSGASGYKVGDIVELYSNNGSTGKARVANTTNISGIVDFSLINGGWGYTSNAEILISDKVLTVNNVIIDLTNRSGNGSFEIFETIVQPLSIINYTNFSGEIFANNDIIYKYTNNEITGISQILTISNTTSNTGTLLVSLVENNFNLEYDLSMEDSYLLNNELGTNIGLVGFNIESFEDSVDFFNINSLHTEELNQMIFENDEILLIENFESLFYKMYSFETESSETILFENNEILLSEIVSSAIIDEFTDRSSYANVIGNSANLTLNIINSTIQFSNNEFVYQISNNNTISSGVITAISYNGSNATLRITNANGLFLSNNLIYSNNSNATGTIVNINTNIGVINISNTFITSVNNYIYGVNSNTYGKVVKVSTGALANLSVSNTLLYDETVNMNTDLIKNYLNVPINAPNYNFPLFPTANLNTIIDSALNFEAITFGSIFNLTTTNPGINYDTAPFVVVYDPLGLSFSKRDFILEYSNNTGTFFNGEIINFNNKNLGIIKTSNNTHLFVERISVQDLNNIISTEFDDFEHLLFEDSYNMQLNETIVGELSGTKASVINYTSDSNTNFIGFNAVINANTITASGYVTNLNVYNSGYGYKDGELITFKNSNNEVEGTAIVNLSNYGFGEGYYLDNDSALSSNKYIHDGDFYQEFSYVIISPIILNKYEGMLRNILHVAGTKYFSEYSYPQFNKINTSIKNSTIEIIS